MFRKPGSLLLILTFTCLPFTRAQLSAHNPTYESLRVMTPFWLSDVQYNESVLLVSVNNIPAEASLLYHAARIISVRNARLTEAYARGSDWDYINGKLLLTSRSKCPFLTDSQLYPVKAVNPEAEFILTGPLHANPEAALFEGKQPQYEAKLEELKDTGVTVVNMTGVHAELLKHKKLLDLTGNNVNHPNDYLIRWFAQEIAYTLIKPDITPDFKTGQKVDGDMIGFSYNKEYNLPDYVAPARFEQDLDIQKSSGAKWVKLECPFTDFEPVAPASPGDPDDKGFDWKTADRMFNAVKARGLNLLWTIRGTPAWASAVKGTGNHDTAPNDNLAFGNFCKAVVLKYLPQAKAAGIKMAFEIWSEPNKGTTFLPFSCDINTQPAVVAACFVERCIKPGYSGIHSAIDNLKKKYGGYTYSDAQVIVGGLLSDNTVTDGGPGQTNTPELWVKAFYSNGAKDYFDAISAHCHCFPDTSDFINSGGMIHTEKVYQIMSNNGDGNKKIWATGIGWPTRGSTGIAETKLPSCLNEFFDTWYKQKFAGPWIYFQLRDIDSGSGEPVNNFGLLHTDYTLKKGYSTFSGRINSPVR